MRAQWLPSMDAMDVHLDASSAEPGELILHAPESGIVGAGIDRHLESSPRARPQRIVANRLRRIRREFARALQFARPVIPAGHDACPDAHSTVPSILGDVTFAVERAESASGRRAARTRAGRTASSRRIRGVPGCQGRARYLA